MKDKTHKIILIAILICSYCNAQTTDFIVTASLDTIYVDKINLTDFEVKTKTAGIKKAYKTEDIVSYYISKENKYYERKPLEKKELKEPDKYDYRRNENLYSEEYKNRIKYKFIERLTNGKIKLFTEVLTEGGIVIGVPGPTGSVTAVKNEMYYISIFDSKPELISDYGKLKLTKEVYELLKIYLYGNDTIARQLDQLFLSKPVAGKEQIINLVNEYNTWAASNK